MSNQSDRKAQDALDALDQAFAYYTPEKRPECKSPAYDDAVELPPLAA